MSDMANRIKQLRQEKGLTLEQVADVVGVGKSTVRKWETGMIANMRRDKIASLARALNTTPAYLMGWEEDEENPRELELCDSFQELDIDDQIKVVEKIREFVRDRTIPLDFSPIKRKKLPLLGNVACGEPKYADEQLEAYVSADGDIDADFCLRANGDSMINARIFDGDILFVKCQDDVDDGEIAVVLIDDETTVKRFYHDKENDIITLVPENPTYKPMRYTGAKLGEIRVLGKVITGQYNIV